MWIIVWLPGGAVYALQSSSNGEFVVEIIIAADQQRAQASTEHCLATVNPLAYSIAYSVEYPVNYCQNGDTISCCGPT